MRTILPRLTRVGYAAFGGVAALSAMALWGGAFGLPWLRDIGADYAPMSLASALAFLMLAASFLAAERGRRAAAVVAAGLTALLAAAALAESYFLLDLNLDIAPAASLTLLLGALATPLSRNTRVFGVPLSAAAAAVMGAVAFFALLGLSQRVLRFDIAAPLLGFSAPGALAAMLVAVGLAAARPSR